MPNCVSKLESKVWMRANSNPCSTNAMQQRRGPERSAVAKYECRKTTERQVGFLSLIDTRPWLLLFAFNGLKWSSYVGQNNCDYLDTKARKRVVPSHTDNTSSFMHIVVVGPLPESTIARARDLFLLTYLSNKLEDWHAEKRLSWYTSFKREIKLIVAKTLKPKLNQMQTLGRMKKKVRTCRHTSTIKEMKLRVHCLLAICVFISA